MQCIVIIVLKIEPAGQVRYNKQQLNSQRRAKHVRNTIEMKSYPSLNSDTGCSNGWSSICDLFVAWALDERDLLFLHSYIGRTPFSYPCVLCKKVRPIRAKNTVNHNVCHQSYTEYILCNGNFLQTAFLGIWRSAKSLIFQPWIIFPTHAVKPTSATIILGFLHRDFRCSTFSKNFITPPF